MLRCSINKYTHREYVKPTPFQCHAIRNKNVLLEHCYNQKVSYTTKTPQYFIISILHRVSGNNISNFHMFDIKNLYLSVTYIVKNAPGHLCYYLCTGYDIQCNKWSHYNGYQM